MILNNENLSLASKSRYVFPNVITALSLVMGLSSCFYSFHGHFVMAGWLIMYSVVLDKLDGSAARALKASSAFGVQFDSLSDFVAFGIAPVFLVFSICISDPQVNEVFLEKETPFFLYFSLVFFVLASAMRLARFNVTASENDNYMFGMATTVAGGLISAYVLTCYNHIEYSFFVRMLQVLPYVLLVLGGLEISNLPMEKFAKKKTKFLRYVDFAAFFLAFLCVLTRSVPEFLLLGASSMVTIGFVRGFRDRMDIHNGNGKEDNPCESKEVPDSETFGGREMKH